MSQQLSLDNTINRILERETRNPPKSPLNEEEKQRLIANCTNYCHNAYYVRIVKTGLMGTDENEETVSESYIFMNSMLEKFDKHYYLNKISLNGEGDVDGKKEKKTLEFYFETFFSHRLNLLAIEIRREKKLKGIGPRSMPMEITYDEVDENSFDSSEESESLILIKEKILLESKELRRFYTEKYILEITDKEMREDWGSDYNSLDTKLVNFFKSLKNK